MVELVAQDWDIGHRVVVGRRGIQAEEAPLPDHVAVGIKLLDADVVHVRSTVHRGSRVRLAQDEQARLTGLGSHTRRQDRKGQRDSIVFVTTRRFLAQDAQSTCRHRAQRILTLNGDQVVFPVSEERQVVVHQPLKQCPRLVNIMRIDTDRRVLVEFMRNALGLCTHRLPVRRGLAYVAQYASSGVDQRLKIIGHEVALDFDAHPGFDERIGRRVIHIDIEHIFERAVIVPPNG